MPYYIYSVNEQPFRQLKKLEEHEVYKEASARVKQIRAELPKDSPSIIKMIHAETEIDADDLLNQVREPAPELGDD